MPNSAIYLHRHALFKVFCFFPFHWIPTSSEASLIFYKMISHRHRWMSEITKMVHKKNPDNSISLFLSLLHFPSTSCDAKCLWDHNSFAKVLALQAFAFLFTPLHAHGVSLFFGNSWAAQPLVILVTLSLHCCCGRVF